MKQIPKNICEIAKKLRNNMTQAEIFLWLHIQNEKLWYKFLRQKPIHVFTEDTKQERYIIADFYCSEKKIILEVDGKIHNQKDIFLLDREKENLLMAQWFRVLRFTNEEILWNIHHSLNRLQNELSQILLSSPFEKGSTTKGFRQRLADRSSPFEKGSTPKGGGITRCGWVKLDNPAYIAYHDEEWGKAVHDDRTLFEFLILEGAQAWLSWETVLKKRDDYTAAFYDFDVEKCSELTDQQLEEILQNPGVIRNRLKIYSVRKNALAFLQIQKEFGSFSRYLWNFVGDTPIINHPRELSDVPARTDLSDMISKDLKKRGMSFVGSTIIYAYMQAVWVVDDHIEDCFCKNI